MIGVDGQYRASFTIGDQKDFLRESELTLFKVLEDTSNILPIFQLDINIRDETIMKYLNEGNNLTISLGKDMNDMSSSVFKPTKVLPSRFGEHMFSIHMVGMYNAFDYMAERRLSISDKKKSTDVMKEIVSSYGMTFTTNATTSDAMHWIQPNTTDRSFVSHLWHHSYIPDSFAALGITIDGEVRFTDITKLSKEPYKFKFSTDKGSDSDLSYETPYSYTNSSSVNNQIAGFGKEKLVANLEAGTFTLLTQDPPDPMLALSNVTVTDKEVSPRYDEHANQSVDNVHENFWKAKMKNVVSLYVFSTVKIKLVYFFKYVKIHVLDLVYFKEEELGSHRKFASETITGLYVVTKVSRVIENKVFKTYVEMCREAPNSIRGNLD